MSPRLPRCRIPGMRQAGSLTKSPTLLTAVLSLAAIAGYVTYRLTFDSGEPSAAATAAAAPTPDGQADHEHEALADSLPEIVLDDLTGTTAGGLHLATMGGVWQALAYGFAGLRAEGAVLRVDPSLPRAWDALAVRLRYRGNLVEVRLEHERVLVEADRRLPVSVGTSPPTYGTSFEFRTDDSGWRVVAT